MKFLLSLFIILFLEGTAEAAATKARAIYDPVTGDVLRVITTDDDAHLAPHQPAPGEAKLDIPLQDYTHLRETHGYPDHRAVKAYVEEKLKIKFPEEKKPEVAPQPADIPADLPAWR